MLNTPKTLLTYYAMTRHRWWFDGKRVGKSQRKLECFNLRKRNALEMKMFQECIHLCGR